MLEVRLEPITHCSIRTSAREKGQWQPTQPLLCEILCVKGQSQPALASLCEMAGAKVEPTIPRYSTRICACEKT